ncbi:MAG: hypothetical protein ACKOQ2_13500, partial [Dolichospermum sp.]
NSVNLFDSLGLAGEQSNKTPGQKIIDSVNELGNFSTKDGPEKGNKACAFAVNKVIKNAGLNPVGKNPKYVPSVEADLKSGRGEKIKQSEAKAGDLAISSNTGHIGICLNDGCTKIRSNSSSKAQFKWDSNDNFDGYYGKGNTRFYRLKN